MTRIRAFFSRLRNKGQETYIYIVHDIKKRPLTNLVLALGLLVLLIIFSNILQKPQSIAQENRKIQKTVTTYNIGGVPRLSVQAQTEKSGVIQVVAMSGGVVQKIHFNEGQEVEKGALLVSLSSNYQGGNAFSVQRQLAETQYNSTQETYQLQKDLLTEQRNIATASAENTSELRRITDQSLGDTRQLVTLNETLLRTVEDNLKVLESAPAPNQELVGAARLQQVQLLASVSQARSAVRNTEYQAQADNPPAELAQFQRDLTFKQLALQEKTLETSKEAARLQLQLARVSEGLMYPTAPFGGTVQRVFVKEGQTVNPGTPLLVISQYADEDPITAVAYVSAEVAKKVSFLEPSVLHFGKISYESYPSFVTDDAVQGIQYAVYYDVPESFAQNVVEQGFITVDIPVGYQDTLTTATFVPLDAVYQTNEDAYIFVEEKGRAKNLKVKLGDVYGSYVEVLSGIKDGDKVIVSRNVVDGDSVSVNK